MARPLVIVGAGGHARSCIDVIEMNGQFDVVGLIGRTEEIGRTVLAYPVIGSDADLSALAGQGACAIIAVGQIRTDEVRRSLFERLCRIGFELPVIVSPLAHVSRHAEVGNGSIIMHYAMVNAGARVGSNCIINTAGVIEHDSQVGDHCHISTGAILNGGVRVGAGCFVGSRSVVREGCSIGEGSVIGAGLTVRRDVMTGTVFTG